MVTQAKLQKIGIIIFAVALQIQTTVSLPHIETGLRVNIADLFLPVLGICILFTLLTRHSKWPTWDMPHIYLWLSGFFLFMVGGLINGYLFTGDISRWGLINKLMGSGILCAYFLLFSWFMKNTDIKNIKLFIVASILSFSAFVFGSMVLQFVEHITDNQNANITDLWAQGLSGNRNTAALLFCVSFCFAGIFHFSKDPILPNWFLPALSFFTPFFVFYNASRALILCLAIAIPVLLILKFKTLFKPVLLPLLCGAVVLAGIIFVTIDHRVTHRYFTPAKLFVSTTATLSSENWEDSDVSYKGDQNRLVILKMGLEAWKDNPVFGIGLGSIQFLQKEQKGQVLSVIDSTPGWLLIELGLLGLLFFITLFYLCLRTLYRNQKTRDESFKSTLSLAVLLSLVSFSLIGLFHDLLYTRFLWVILGLALAQGKLSPKKPQGEHTSQPDPA